MAVCCQRRRIRSSSIFGGEGGGGGGGVEDELASTGDNFFEQFVTVDDGDMSVLNGKVMN